MALAMSTVAKACMTKRRELGRTTGGLTVAGIIVPLGWFTAAIVGELLAASVGLAHYATALQQACGLAWLLLCYAGYRWLNIAGAELVGPTALQARPLMLGTLAVAAAYLGHFAYAKATGLPQETWMATLYSGKSPAAIAVFVLVACTLIPIAEEVTYRYFLLGAIPYKRSGPLKMTAIAMTALLFAGIHRLQYSGWDTFVLLLFLGVVFAWARIWSEGMVVPIALHAMAVVLGLMLNELR
jgi:uncharacterized protein